MSGYGHASHPRLSEGSATETVYGLIRDSKHEECARYLEAELANAPTSRPALSLLGYCHYYLGNFDAAASYYERLCRAHPGNDAYRLHHAQSLFKASAYPEALRATKQIEDPALAERVAQLQAAIAFEEDDTATCRARLDRCPPDDPDVAVNVACCLLKEGKFEEARAKFADAQQALGYQADLAYNIALCHYRMKQFGPALKHLAEIVERGVRDHPELSVGAVTEGVEVKSVGNTPVLKETALIEAFNLKAAIEYVMKNPEATREALTDMPPRSEEELDPVTLHNAALMNMDENPTDGFHKLNFLLQSPPFPPETFGNLLLLYCKPQHAFYDLAADVMAENQALVAKHLPADLYEYLDASILSQTSPEEAYRKYDDLAGKHADELRRLTKKIQDARLRRDSEKIKRAVAEYDDALEAYVPALTAQAKVYWDLEHYQQVERILKQSAEFCGEHETWRLNMAHTYFMQSLREDEKYGEAIRFYEPIVAAHLEENVLNVTAIVLANLCVAYIMTSQNEEAEELMRRIEKEEERATAENPERRCFHLCIVNLVIGTLYCAKGNYEFGISRVIKSLEPYDTKLETDTWFYAKRCFLSLVEGMTKHTVAAKDETMHEIFAFLEEAERHGKGIAAAFGGVGTDGVGDATRTLATEARMLKKMFLKLRDV